MKDGANFYISAENLDLCMLSPLTARGCVFSRLSLNLWMSFNSLALVPGNMSRTNHNSITQQQRRKDSNDLEKPRTVSEVNPGFSQQTISSTKIPKEQWLQPPIHQNTNTTVQKYKFMNWYIIIKTFIKSEYTVKIHSEKNQLQSNLHLSWMKTCWIFAENLWFFCCQKVWQYYN